MARTSSENKSGTDAGNDVWSAACQSKTRTVRRIARRRQAAEAVAVVEDVTAEGVVPVTLPDTPVACLTLEKAESSEATTISVKKTVSSPALPVEEEQPNTTLSYDLADCVGPYTQAWKGNTLDMEKLPMLQFSARAWEKFAETSEEEWRNGEGMSTWHARRKENALSRLLFIEKERSKKGLPTLDWLVSDLGAQSCLMCANGQNAGRICNCSMSLLDQRSGFVIDGPSTSASSEAGADEAEESRDELDVDWFSPPPGLGVQLEEDKPGNWRRLLHGPPAIVGGSTTANIRTQNVAWRRWWDTHNSQGSSRRARRMSWYWNARHPQQFPATPTSTSPGSPRFGPCDMVDESAFVAPTVNFTVPLHLAPQVQQFIANLLAQNSNMPAYR